MADARSFPQTNRELVRLQGGLDLVTSTLDLKPGVLRDSLNYEINTTGGYSRIAGYERYDGRPNPSDAAVSSLIASAVTGLAVGDSINGQTSGATGVIIAISGTSVFYTKATGAFTVGENLREGLTVIGTITATAAGLTNAQTLAQYLNLAADVYRADIQAVPGSGPVRGVAWYGDNLYAWRDNVGATAMVMHKASGSGWATVALGSELAFTAGLAAGIVDGNTVTGLTSGATGVVARVVVQSGSFAANNAAGRLILSSTSGTFVAAETLRVAGTNRATASGAATAITLQPGGRVRTDQGSVAGGATIKLYGADGVNRGFEFDGTTYVPVATGMTSDMPDHVKLHQRHLFFAFGNSVQHSGVGEPYLWSPIFGAAELTINGDLTDWAQMPGAQTTGALVMYTRNTTHVLYGTDSADWNLVAFQRDTGAYAHSAQPMSSIYALDDRGVLELSASQNYGNFADTSLTVNIAPWLQTRRNLAVGSSINREKSQYRLFFSDGTGLYITIVNGRLRGCMPVQFSHAVACACNGETGSGAETNFFGSTNGYVYRLDAGTSFDGDAIPATGLLVFSNQGGLRINKRYRSGTLEVRGNSYLELQIGYNLAYGDATRVDQGVQSVYPNAFQAPYWDSFTWDNFVWDGLSLGPLEFFLTGTAENIAVRVDSNSDYFQPYTLNSLILEYTVRRGLRYAE